MKLELQLHGGGGGGSAPQVKQSAPGSQSVATIDNTTEDERLRLKEKLSSARGKKYTDKTGGSELTLTVDTVKKMLLGE